MVFHLCTIKPAISLWYVEPFHLMTWRTGGLHAELFLTKETHLLAGVNYSGGVILDRKIMTPVMSNRVKPRTWSSCWLCETAREWPFIVTHCVVTCQNGFKSASPTFSLLSLPSGYGQYQLMLDLTISGDISIGSRRHVGTQVPTVYTVRAAICVL